MKINYYVNSVQGQKTPVNQDSYAIPEPDDKNSIKTIDTEKKGYLFIVCDGVGGHNYGEVASSMAANLTMKAYYEEEESDLITIIKSVNRQIFALSQQQPQYKNMGTTIVALLLKEGEALAYNTGDSRVYLFDYDKSELKQINEDHSLVWDYYRKGLITKNDMINNPKKNIITEAMGIDKETAVNSYNTRLPNKFLFLLCSDGLTDVLIDDEIRELILSSKSLPECTDNLIQAALKAASYDDITVLTVSNNLGCII